MSKTFNLFIILAVLALFALPGHSEAAAVTSASAGFGSALTIGSGDLGSGSSAQTFTSSSGVQLGYAVDAAGNYFTIASQHQKGDTQYGLHSNGGGLYGQAVTTTGTWQGAAPTATSDPTADFSAWTLQH